MEFEVSGIPGGRGSLCLLEYRVDLANIGEGSVCRM